MGGLVSVITAVHAPSVPYLAEAWRSLAEQQMPEGWAFEWLVQQDGEAAAGEALPAGDARICVGVWRSGGVAVARTMALARAKGSLVRVLDADDLLTPGALARDLAAFEGRPDIGWATSAALDLAADGSTGPPAQPDPPGGPLAGADLLRRFREDGYRLPVHPATLCIRKELAVALGGWMALPMGEDTGLLMAAAAVRDGYFTTEPGLHYRRHDDHVSRDAHADEPEWQARMTLVDQRAEALAALVDHGTAATPGRSAAAPATPAPDDTDDTDAGVDSTGAPVQGKFVRAYQWSDRFGTVRQLDVFAERTRDAQVWVYTPDKGDGRELVAMVTTEGRFLRHSGAADACGLDTARAWNNLIEICRQAHIADNYG